MSILFNGPEPFPSISVSGTAEVSVVPDRAVLTFSIVSREATLDAAVADNDEKINSVVDFLKSNKVESRCIRTEVMQTHPLYDEQHRREPGVEVKISPIGFSVQRGLTVKITDLTSFEKISGGLVKQGVNKVNGVRFETSELRKHRDEARLLAVRLAKEKAAAMAAELGATLECVHSIAEQSHAGDMYFRQQSQCRATGAGGEGGGAGEIEIKAVVNVVFRLKVTDLSI